MILAIDAHNLRAGGGVTHLVSLLKYADPAAHFSDVHVFTGSACTGRLAAGLSASVRIVHEPALDGGLASRTWWHRTMLRRRLESLGADVLFTPGGLLPPSWPQRTAAVTMCRNMLPFQSEEAARYGLSGRRLRLALLRRGQLRSFRRADAVIFLSAFARAHVETLTGPLKGATVIAHGVDEEFRHVEGRPGNGLEILYVSTIDLYKHQWHVVSALRLLRERTGRDWRLTLAGSAYPPALARVRESIRKHGLEAAVTVAGEIPHAALPAYYARAAAAVFASSCENCPNALLEAMAAGAAIACSNRPPMPEFAGDAVEYCDPEQPASIAAALERFVGGSASAPHFGRLARARADGFQWRETAAETLRFLAAAKR